MTFAQLRNGFMCDQFILLPGVYEQSRTDTELSLGVVPSGCIPDTPVLRSLAQPLIYILGTVGDQGTGKSGTSSLETCARLGSYCGSIRSHLPMVQRG